MKRKIFGRLLATVIVVSLLFSQTVFAADSVSEDKDLQYLKSIMDMIKEKYKGNISDQQLVEGALKGMFGTMDPYTTYFTMDEAKSFADEVGGIYGGIGVMMTKIGDFIVVTKVFAASPADTAGISTNDRIVSANGKSLVGASADEASAVIRGKDGSKITLGIMKSGEKEIKTVELIRSEIKVNPVTYEIKNNIGYIRLDMFNANTKEYMTKAFDEMDSKGIKKIILDLRNNPGGEVNQAVALAQRLVPEGLITKLDFKSDAYEDEEYYSHLKNTQYKLVVLVNEMSASASEILAGAIQDTKAGTLVGTKTFGKGVVQVMVPILTPEAYDRYSRQVGVKVLDALELINKYQIMPKLSEVIGQAKITVAEYYTPKGRMIDKQGLTPDVEVPDPEVNKAINIYNIQKLQKKSKPGLNSESIDVYNAERILKLAGYDVDTPDMKLDEKTSRAIAKFQLEHGGYPGGTLDFITQQWLNEKMDQLLMDVDKQYQKAVEILNQ